MLTARVLLLDKGDVMAAVLGEQFTQLGEFELDHDSSEMALGERLSQGAQPDLILLRHGGEIDGIEVSHRLRQRGVKLPIILLGPRGAEAAMEEAGVTDCLTRPVRFPLLVARLRAHLRQHEQSEDAIFTLGPYQFHPHDKVLARQGGEVIRLTDKEAAILRYLHRAGRSVPRTELLDEVWGYNSGVTTHTLETHIYRLRQKIEPQQREASLLLTDAGGYRLASVEKGDG